MRHLAIGDIHGCIDQLLALESGVPFRDDDVLIVLGDFVDRGPATRDVLDWLIERQARGNLVTLRGNHEVMMLEARMDREAYLRWHMFGGQEAIESYGEQIRPGTMDDIPEAHWHFIASQTRPFYEIDSHFFVHAHAKHDVILRDQTDECLYWERFDDPQPHMNGKIMVCGHTAQRDGKPDYRGHAVCIDTCAYGSGFLTCLDVASGHFWQADLLGGLQSGEISACLDKTKV